MKTILLEALSEKVENSICEYSSLEKLSYTHVSSKDVMYNSYSRNLWHIFVKLPLEIGQLILPGW